MLGAYNCPTISSTSIGPSKFYQHIFEHIKGPLSGLFWRTDKCRSKDLIVLLPPAVIRVNLWDMQEIGKY